MYFDDIFDAFCGVDDIKFARKDGSVKFPTKRDEDGCYDVYAHITENFMIPSHTNELVPTGLYSAFDKKYRIAVRERGSNTKANMIVMAGQIDSGYRGEWFVSIYNGNDKDIVLSNDVDRAFNNGNVIYVPTSKAIAQFAIEYVPVVSLSEISVEELQEIDSERGTDALGSSNK
nr:MAG TPA: deoxyuridine 5'-triphosphate nucleotidohydrolase [Caudoviricetes sp.]